MVIVNPNPPTPTVSVSGSTLTSSSATGNQWYLNGTPITGATGQTYVAPVNGTYTVAVTSGGCTSAESSPVVITGAGIDEASNTGYISIFPDPNDGNFDISFSGISKSNYTLMLYNSLGQVIYEEEIKDFTGSYSRSMNISGYGPGIYSLRLFNTTYKIARNIVVH
jgi:hypothetical protein